MNTGVKILDIACDITRNDRVKFSNIYRHVPTGELNLFLQEFLAKYLALEVPPSEVTEKEKP